MTEQTTQTTAFEKNTLLKSSRKRRIAAFIIDHFVMTFLIVSIAFIALAPNLNNENNTSKIFTTMLFVMIPGFILYFAKDSLKGISFGKWIMGIMVREENNFNKTPSFGRLFLRNLFVIIWPIELIVLASNDQRKRLGDKITKTVVVKNPIKPTKSLRVLTLIGIVITFFMFVFLFAGNAMKNSEAYKIATKEIEQNTEIISETGGIKGYGMIPKGNVSTSNGYGQAQLQIKVLGNKKDLNISVYLEKKPDNDWQIIELKK